MNVSVSLPARAFKSWCIILQVSPFPCHYESMTKEATGMETYKNGEPPSARAPE